MVEADSLNAIEKYLLQLPDKFIHFGEKAILAVICFVIGIQIIKFIQKMINKAMHKKEVDKSIISFTDSVVKFGLYCFMVISIVAAFGVETTSLVAILGSFSVAIGLALQGSLCNLAGGFLLLLLKPFVTGEYIIDEKGNEGYVVSINIFYTKILTLENRIVMLPNGTLANGSIINSTRTKLRRIDILVNVGYKTDLSKAKTVLLDMLEKDPAVSKDKEYTILVEQLGDNGIELIIRCFVPVETLFQDKSRLTESTKNVLDQAGIEIPFPQMDIHTK